MCTRSSVSAFLSGAIGSVQLDMVSVKNRLVAYSLGSKVESRFWDAGNTLRAWN